MLIDSLISHAPAPPVCIALDVAGQRLRHAHQREAAVTLQLLGVGVSLHRRGEHNQAAVPGGGGGVRRVGPHDAGQRQTTVLLHVGAAWVPAHRRHHR
jgi:hypothetical protein